MISLSSRMQLFLVPTFSFVVLLFTISFSPFGASAAAETAAAVTNANETSQLSSSRKLKRTGEGCSPDYIVVNQAPTAPLPSGISTYTVHILNLCLSDGCQIHGIHLSCGWFSSAHLINPLIFRRLGYNDCLVNDGRAITAGRIVTFQYADTFKYPMSISAAACIP